MEVVSQVEYLSRKLAKVEKQIEELTSKQNQSELLDQIYQLYFQKGKLYAEIELLKRVPAYDE